MVIVDSPFTIDGDVPPLVGFTRQPTADLVSYLPSSGQMSPDCHPIRI